MPRIIFLPHPDICPHGASVDAHPGESIIEAALANGIEIDHACEMSCACTTCHVYVREGGESLTAQQDDEEDLLDRAWGLDPDSRLSCQARLGDEDIVVELPLYTTNLDSGRG